jgi:transcriptional regulator with XRE-family HTH domain
MRRRQVGDMEAERLLKVRRALRLSQDDMARLLGVAFASVNRWENGHSAPSGVLLYVYHALDLALRLGKKAGEIISHSGADPGRRLYQIFHAAYGDQTVASSGEEQT